MKVRVRAAANAAARSRDTVCQPLAVSSGPATKRSSTGPLVPSAARCVVVDVYRAHPIVGHGKITVTVEKRSGEARRVYVIRDHHGYLLHDFPLQVDHGAVMTEARDYAVVHTTWEKRA